MSLHISLTLEPLGDLTEIPLSFPCIERVSCFHITLTRPSRMPPYLEQNVIQSMREVCHNLGSLRVFLRPQVDVFISENGGLYVGVPVDLDVSPQLNHLISSINQAVSSLGLREFHDEPNPHITVATIAYSSTTEVTRSLTKEFVLSGPPGSQYFAAVQTVDEALANKPIACKCLQIKIGTTVHLLPLE